MLVGCLPVPMGYREKGQRFGPANLHKIPSNIGRVFFIMETFHVYIIFSGGINKFYVGYTSDLPRRLDEHNSGVSTFTSRANDWEIKYVETYPAYKQP